MEKHIIEEKNIKVPVSGTNKKGQPYTIWNVGLKIKGEWYNQGLFNKEQVDQIEKLDVNEELECELYEDEYQGKMYKRFKLPAPANKMDLILEKLDKIMDAMKVMNAKLPKNE